MSMLQSHNQRYCYKFSRILIIEIFFSLNRAPLKMVTSKKLMVDKFISYVSLIETDIPFKWLKKYINASLLKAHIENISSMNRNQAKGLI